MLMIYLMCHFLFSVTITWYRALLDSHYISFTVAIMIYAMLLECTWWLNVECIIVEWFESTSLPGINLTRHLYVTVHERSRCSFYHRLAQLNTEMYCELFLWKCQWDTFLDINCFHLNLSVNLTWPHSIISVFTVCFTEFISTIVMCEACWVFLYCKNTVLDISECYFKV